MSDLKLEWYESADYYGCSEADFCGGLLTLVASDCGWSIYDGNNDIARCDEPQIWDVRHNKAACEAELQRRLRMAAETLDPSWLEAERDEDEPIACSGCLFVGEHAPDCPVLHAAKHLARWERLDGEFKFEPKDPADQELATTAMKGVNWRSDAWSLEASTDPVDYTDPIILYEVPYHTALFTGVSEDKGYDQILSMIKEEAKAVKL